MNKKKVKIRKPKPRNVEYTKDVIDACLETVE